MLDKNLIENKFKNSINFYDDILEIGSYSGILTKKIVEKFDFENYLAIDIVDSFHKIENLSPKISFQKIDVEKFTTDRKFDLIIANASLQWCNDFSNTIQKLKTFLNDNGILAITIFSTDNFYEIKDVFNVSLKYKTIEEIEEIFSKNARIIQEIHTLQFKTPKELLKHLKLTGVNAITKNSLSVSEIKEKMEILEKSYQNKLTYKPIYIID